MEVCWYPFKLAIELLQLSLTHSLYNNNNLTELGQQDKLEGVGKASIIAMRNTEEEYTEVTLGYAGKFVYDKTMAMWHKEFDIISVVQHTGICILAISTAYQQSDVSVYYYSMLDIFAPFLCTRRQAA